jgi:hypothetical protein
LSAARLRARSIAKRQRLPVLRGPNEICASRRSAPSAFFEDANNVLAHDLFRKPVTAFRNHADEESSKTRAQKRRGNKNYCRNKIVAILFSKVQCSRGKRVRDLKRHYFAPIRWCHIKK